MVEDFTPHAGLPLPHPSNSLEDDVLRLRNALSGVDAALAAISTDKTAKDEALVLIGDAIDAATAARLAITGRLDAIDDLLACDDVDLNTLQEVVDALKDNVMGLFDHVGAGGTEHAAATAAVAGFMPAADKAKLDGVTLGLLFDTFEATATASQTAFTVTGGYTPGAIIVFKNGAKLKASAYTATTSPTLTLSTGAAASDVIEVVRFKRALSV